MFLWVLNNNNIVPRPDHPTAYIRPPQHNDSSGGEVEPAGAMVTPAKELMSPITLASALDVSHLVT